MGRGYRSRALRLKLRPATPTCCAGWAAQLDRGTERNPIRSKPYWVRCSNDEWMGRQRSVTMGSPGPAVSGIYGENIKASPNAKRNCRGMD